MKHELIKLENEINLFEEFIANSEELSVYDNIDHKTLQPIGKIVDKYYGIYLRRN